MGRRVTITRRFVKYALRRYAAWGVDNEALYALCRKHPEHHCVDEVVAKVSLIGRFKYRPIGGPTTFPLADRTYKRPYVGSGARRGGLQSGG